MDIIFIRGLEFYGYIGVSEEERKVGHRFKVEVELEADLRKAAQTDDVADTTDYAAVSNNIITIGTGIRAHLLETTAERMALGVLDNFPYVLGVRIRLEKCLPPFNQILQAVGVEIVRWREDAS